MMSKLFLFDVQIGTIQFVDSFKPFPQKEKIMADIKFGDVTVTMDPNILPLIKSDDPKNYIGYNIGKTYLFISSPSELISNIKKTPLKISLRIEQKIIATATIDWSQEQLENAINKYESTDIPTPVTQHGEANLKNEKGEGVCKMIFKVELTGFSGGVIESQFRTEVVGHQKEYVFKEWLQDNQFTCQLYEEKTPIHNLNIFIDEPGQHMSWTEIFGADMKHPRPSVSPFQGSDFQPGMIPLTDIFKNTSVETISIVFRPDENKFFDLKAYSGEKVEEKKSDTKPDEKQKSKEVEVPPENTCKMLMAEQITKKLCKNKDCPGVRKFMEYGIGQKAHLRDPSPGNVQASFVHELSHTCNLLSNYGPEGVYSRPKRPEQPFMPSKNALETKLPPEKTCCECCNDAFRLRGGGPWPHTTFNPVKNINDNNAREDAPKWSDILRLKGGSPVEAENPPESQGLKSPIKECKAVMDKFDQILNAYKKALGPCGQAYCPNVPHLVQERCKKECGKGQNFQPGKDETNLCETPCKEKDFAVAACRDPKCAYAKYKLSLVDDDAALELQFLPPAISGKCGHPKCPYPIKPDLPPIHWDCPDPLPKGICKNLNCPLQPQDLRKIKCPDRKPGPCGSPDCPYALPPPCELPTCPFRIQPTCPYLKKEKKKKSCCQSEEEKEADEFSCKNPECPFANEEISMSESFEQSNATGQFMDCSNPQCPFATSGKRIPKPKSDNPNVCGNPSCPFSKVRRINVCGNPFCPYAPQKQNSLYGNPNCPFVEKSQRKTKKSDACDNPDCPFAGDSGSTSSSKIKSKDPCETCDNPNCPFAEKSQLNSPFAGDSSCKNSQKKSSEVCDNPDCPFAEKSKATCRYNDKKSDVCDNPDCPFALDSDTKDSPKKKSKGMSGACDNPNCPFAEKSKLTCRDKDKKSEICDNPDCAFLRNSGITYSSRKNSKDISGTCDNPNCSFVEKSNSNSPFAGDGSCKHFQKRNFKNISGTCDNPDCPFAQRSKEDSPFTDACGNKNSQKRNPKVTSETCDNPTCPFSQISKTNSPLAGDSTCKNSPRSNSKSISETCDNPNCPFAQKSKTNSPLAGDSTCNSSPRSNSKSISETCDNPNCPFAQKSKTNSPLAGDSTCKSSPRSNSKSISETCDNPNCPFAQKSKTNSPLAGDSTCKSSPRSNSKSISETCDNPNCPFAQKSKTNSPLAGDSTCKSSPRSNSKSISETCDNPNCPFAQKSKTNSPLAGDSTCKSSPRSNSKSISETCDNPNCPFAEKSKFVNDSGCKHSHKRNSKSISETCDNPNCPSAAKSKYKDRRNDICENPDCPFTGDSGFKYSSKRNSKSISETCGNPNCPFAGKSITRDRGKDICDNPDCPFAGDIASKSKSRSETCDNPDCPFNEENCSKDSADCNDSQSVCDNPDCPYAKEKEETTICDNPMCPYGQPLPSCGIPGCPYEPVPFISYPGPRKPKPTPTCKHQNAVIRVETEVRRMSAQQGNGIKTGGGDNGAAGGENEEGKNGKRKRKKRGQYVYSMGNQYPGVKLGHKECVTPQFNVPPKMGWLWNIPMVMTNNVKPRRGWRPGAIQKTIAAKIRAHRQAKGLGMLRLPKFKRNKDGDTDDELNVAPKPTLQIQKKEGAYWITMNPLKDPKTLADNEDPYMDCTPLQFKISKNKKRNELDENGSTLCYCDEEESSSSSDSELDIEFTPPAGIIHPERFKKRKNIVHCEVQYDTKDFETKKEDGKDKKKEGEEGKGGKKGKGGKGEKGEKGGKGGKGDKKGKEGKEGKDDKGKDDKGKKDDKGGKGDKGKKGDKGEKDSKKGGKKGKK